MSSPKPAQRKPKDPEVAERDRINAAAARLRADFLRRDAERFPNGYKLDDVKYQRRRGVT